MDDTSGQLVTLISRFAKHAGLSISTVSRHATGSGDTVARLQRGGTITLKRFDRAVRFLSDNWPDSVAWPTDFPRPGSSRRASKRRRNRRKD